jgi:competence protein ComEC
VPTVALDLLHSGMRHWQPLFEGFEPGTSGEHGAVALFLCAALLLPLPPLRWRRVVLPLLAVPLLLPQSSNPGDEASVVVFDVGQGSAVLLRDGEGVLLYDTGPGPPDGPAVARRAILPLLHRDRVDALEMLIVSHPDLDHAAGERLIRESVPPRRVRRGAGPADAEESCRTGRRERLGNAASLLYLAGSRPGDSDNNASCVVLVELRGHRFLLPGDIDAERERDLVAYWGKRLGAEVLLAAHHGSGSSSSGLFLKAVDPQFLVVTAGRANRFGHPAAEVLERARNRELTVLNTAFDGALLFHVDGQGQLRCRRLRHRYAPLWRTGVSPASCSAPGGRGYNRH